MKNRTNSISAFTMMGIMVAVAIIGINLRVHAGDDSTPGNQPRKQDTNQPTPSGEISGVVVSLDVDKKLVKLVMWDPDKRGFKRNDAGRYQARTLKWSGDTIIEDQGEKKVSAFATDNGLPDLKSVTDLVGWKTGITFDNGLISRISLVVAFRGESFAGMVGSGSFAFAQQPTGKLPTKRTKQLDKESDSLDKLTQSAPSSSSAQATNQPTVWKDFEQTRTAADKGDAEAQYALGKMYRSGEGVTKDAQQAVMWIRKAAEQGNADAQIALSAMYFKGEGLDKDFQQALMWMNKAADQGSDGAACNMGLLLGSASELTKAYMWSVIGDQQGDEQAAKNREAFAKFVSPSQIEDAKQMAREWWLAHPQLKAKRNP